MALANSKSSSSPPSLPLTSPFSSPLSPAHPPRPAQPGWHVERQGRRRYPPPRDYARELQPGGNPTAFAPPNCSAPGQVGCVAMPRPARTKPAAGARAALWPPACSLSSEPGCLRLPKPLVRTGDELQDSGEAVLRFVDRNVAFLAGKSTYTRSIAAADVDGDGDLDVLFGNYKSPSLVLLNAGDGTFATSIELPGGNTSTSSIAAADVDGDGDLDVLLGNQGSPSRVLLNAGDGTFPTSIELPGGSAGTHSIAAADMDGDGDLDVLLGNEGSPSRVLLNAGDGTFPTSIELPGGSAGTTSIAAADVDGDGDLDVLLGNSGGPSLLLPFIRCSQPGTARSRFGNGCVRCPAPSSRRDDSFDICYECDEHTELDYRGECSSCKPGYVRFVGAAVCTACPRGKRQGEAGTLCVECSPGTYAPYDGLFGPKCLDCERGKFCPPGAAVQLPCHEGNNSSATNLARDEQCPHAPPHAPPTPPADLSAAARGMMVQSYEDAPHITLLVALLVACLLSVACCLWRWWHTRISTQMLKDNAGSVSMHTVSLWAPKPREEREPLSSSGGSLDTDRSEKPTQLEVVDFSTLAIGRPIGQGGFATVWSARWQGNDLAVKVLNMTLENVDMSPAQQELVMLQEVAILRRLRHPCICALFGHMLVDQRPALVLEYMAGGSLAAHLFAKRHAAAAPVAPQGLLGCKLMVPPPPRPHLAGMLSDDKKICFAVQLASGLCFLHSHSILHHDIKTDNALLDANHSVCKLADFGLACLSLNYARDRNKAAVGGTLRYLAPERAAEVSRRHVHESRDRDENRGSSSLSLGRTLVSLEDRADVYAFGLLLWELIHERRAFEELSGAAAASSALKGLRPQLSKPSKSDSIPALTCECWAHRPEDRPNMSTVLEKLETCMQALSVAPSSTSTQMWLQCSDPSSPSSLSCSNESRRAAMSGIFSSKLPVKPETSVQFSSEFRRDTAMGFVPWEEPGSSPPAPDSSWSTRTLD